jgi:hypothetical protein
MRLIKIRVHVHVQLGGKLEKSATFVEIVADDILKFKIYINKRFFLVFEIVVSQYVKIL